jgi:hypothetical protein
MLPSPVSPRGGALASPREEGEEDGDEEGDAVGSLSFQDALRAEPPPAAITRAERFSIMVVRSERTRNLLKLEGQQAAEQKEPDYAMNAYGEDGSVSSKVRPAESTVSHAREMWFSAYVLFQERHAGMWKTSVGWMSAQDALNGGTSFMMRLRGKHAKLLVRNGGIPPSWRGGIWEVLTGALTARLDPLHTDYYAKLLAQLQERPTKSTKDIEKDVARTMHGHAWFQDTDGLGQAQLKRGLTAFSFRHPQIGYAQSMSTIFATLLLHYHSEEQAFWVFDRLLLTVLPGDYYTPSMLGVKTDCAVLKKLVRKRLSKLSQHFHKKQVDLDMISLPWFLCLFVHALPMHTTMRIWDALIYKGSHVLLSIAIALLAKHEDELCTMMNMGPARRKRPAASSSRVDCAHLSFCLLFFVARRYLHPHPGALQGGVRL